MKYYVLYNSISDNNKGLENAKKIEELSKEAEFEYFDLIQIESKKEFFAKHKDCQVILTGGDGTVNHFVNSIDEKDIPDNLLYYPSGTGNDFYRDISEKENNTGFIEVKKYFVHLPVAEINGHTYKFLNNVGYGLDGYCCEIADQLKGKSDKPIDYAGIAIKGMLYAFKSRAAKITVDGKVYQFKHVWLAPTMKGKYYGGGMIPCPEQDRDSDKLSLLVWQGHTRLFTLIHFPKVFKGAHVNKRCNIFTGKEIVVEYSKPCAAQVDGETELNVSKVVVKA